MTLMHLVSFLNFNYMNCMLFMLFVGTKATRFTIGTSTSGETVSDRRWVCRWVGRWP